MSIIAFPCCILLLLWAGYAIIRTRLRRYSCNDAVARIKPLSDHARQLIEQNAAGHLPETWPEFRDMYRAVHHLTVFSLVADRFARAIAACTDDYAVANMRDVHRTFMRKRVALIRSMLVGIGYVCCGRVGKRHAKVYVVTFARLYADELLLAHEMAEVMDPHCAALLEGHLLHGS